MKAMEYLKNSRAINASVIAEKMWPTNKTAKSYMSRKLNGERPWTDKDEQLAIKVLHDLGVELTSL